MRHRRKKNAKNVGEKRQKSRMKKRYKPVQAQKYKKSVYMERVHPRCAPKKKKNSRVAR